MNRPWLIRTVAGVVLVLVCVRLGIWQLDRNEQRSARNAVIEANVDRAPAPIDELVAPGQPVAANDEWRTVEVSGRYDVARELVLRLRPVDGQRGVHAVTPLVTDDGAAVLVDRGFVPSNGSDDDQVDVPAPPSGDVTVLARVRRSEERRGGDPAAGTIRYVDVDAIAESVPYPLYGGWGELISQDPPPPPQLQAIPAPEVEAGPHLSYAIQWFLFAAIGVGGYVLLIRAEARGRRKPAGHPGDHVPVRSSEAHERT